MIHPWLQPSWQRLVALGAHLPHAVLFAGPSGLGKRDLADALAARLLCARPDAVAHGQACGSCVGCQLRMSGNHPDLYRLVPESENSNPAGDGSADAATGADAAGLAKAKSAQIVIAQIRELQQALMVTGHQSACRVVIVDPAEAMNAYTANALLKLLEEPPNGCLFVLVSSAPRQLLATVRSRCQQWQFGRPDPVALDTWLSGQSAADQALLPLSGGMPLAAKRLAENGGGAFLARFVRDLTQQPGTDPLRLAGQWEAWLKSKEAISGGFGMAELVGWMQRWVTDLTMLRLGGRVCYFPSHEAVLLALGARASIAAVLNCYNELTRIRRAVRHPLNSRLVLEDMLLRYTRAVHGFQP